jgi:hypothetical protein
VSRCRLEMRVSRRCITRLDRLHVVVMHRALKYLMTNFKWLVAWTCKHGTRL